MKYDHTEVTRKTILSPKNPCHNEPLLEIFQFNFHEEIYFYILYINVFISMHTCSMCTMGARNAHEDHKWAGNPLQPALQTAVNHNMGVGNLTLVLGKNSQCSSLLAISPSPSV